VRNLLDDSSCVAAFHCFTSCTMATVITASIRWPIPSRVPAVFDAPRSLKTHIRSQPEASVDPRAFPADPDWRKNQRAAKAHALAEFESAYLSQMLAAARGNVTIAARMAGKERRSFGKLLKKRGIDRFRFRS
jgi:DNA-binding NtrC family response regulator